MKDYDKQMNLGILFLHIWYHSKISLRNLRTYVIIRDSNGLWVNQQAVSSW